MADGPRHLAPRRTSERPRTVTLVLLVLLAIGAAGGALAWSQQVGEQDAAAVPAVEGAATPATGPSPDTSPAPTTRTTERGPLGSGETVSLAFAGDIHAEGVLRDRLVADPESFVGPFADVLRSADVAVGNLETAIATGGARVDRQFAFRAPPAALDALRAGGFDTLSMANNHGMDFGRDGLGESLAAKRARPAGFVIGIGGDEDEAYAPFSTEVRGQRVAVIGATQVIDNSVIASWTATPDQGGLASAKRVDRLVAEVAAARATHDTVVVFLHWGVETHTCPSVDQQTLARQLVDAGADIIVGGHAHRLQGGGRLGDAVVHYGLGNFLFQANSAEGARTGVFTVEVTGRRIEGYRWVPGCIAGSVPRPLEGAEADEALRHWDDLRSCTGLTR